MKQLSGMDICRWVHTYGELIKTSRINQIYRQGINQLCFALHTKEGKRFLVIIPPTCVLLTEKKPMTDHKETGFGRWMRSNLKGAIINDIYQVGSERIIALVLGKGTLYVELFGKGNLVFVNT